ncbi:MAG TPA: GEVED domain-containing protein [Herpetosiphonaceae bacterium]
MFSLPSRRFTTLFRPLSLVLALGLAVGVAGSQPAYATPGGDLGDAPASTNNFGVGMTAWLAGPPANYPTVFFGGVQPTGPFHQNLSLLFHLGPAISCENQADIGGDCDGANNINPPANTANNDKFDDGINWPLFGTCQSMPVNYVVNVLPGAPTNVFVNVWADWNSNGRWGDTPGCNGMVADEWAVKNQMIALPGPGTFVFTTPNILPIRSGRPQWARITISETPATWPAARVGSGPAGSWKYGETEDYILP